MPAWTTFEGAAPDLARRARAILTSTTNCVLGTLRADGSPRLCGIDPFFVGDRLLLGSMPGARKGADLRRDPRMALHGIPWESRKVKEGAPDPGDGDVKLSAIAVEITDPAENQQIMGDYWAELGVESPPESGDLFIVEPTFVSVIFVEDDQLVIDSWSASAGCSTVRRT